MFRPYFQICPRRNLHMGNAPWMHITPFVKQHMDDVLIVLLQYAYHLGHPQVLQSKNLGNPQVLRQIQKWSKNGQKSPNILYLQMVELPALVLNDHGHPPCPAAPVLADALLLFFQGHQLRLNFLCQQRYYSSYWLCLSQEVGIPNLTKGTQKTCAKRVSYTLGFIWYHWHYHWGGSVSWHLTMLFSTWITCNAQRAGCTLDTASSIRCSRASTRALRCSASHLGGKAVMFLDPMLVIRNRIPPSLNLPLFKWDERTYGWIEQWFMTYCFSNFSHILMKSDGLSFIDFDGCFDGCNIANLPTCSIVMDAWRSGNNQMKLWLAWMSALPTSWSNQKRHRFAWNNRTPPIKSIGLSSSTDHPVLDHMWCTKNAVNWDLSGT